SGGKRCYCNRCPFFFSSRRRHTRWPRDWSSDVCSSDLVAVGALMIGAAVLSFSNGTGLWLFLAYLGFVMLSTGRGTTQRLALREIGRASCRERVEISVVAVS